jgi:hypothetical protein
MKCKQARPSIVLDHYGELSDPERTLLAAHLEKCPDCAAEREETRRVLRLLETKAPAEVPSFDPEKAWRGIRAGLSPTLRPSRRAPALAWRWPLAGAALVLVLVAGIFIGRTFFPASAGSGPGVSALQAKRTSPSVQPVLASHLDDLKPLLLEFANASSDTAPESKVLIDETLVRGLLVQNVLLRRALARRDPAAAELLDDLDLILKEIANRDRSAATSPGSIRDLIRQRDVLFKMEVIKKT